MGFIFIAEIVTLQSEFFKLRSASCQAENEQFTGWVLACQSIMPEAGRQSQHQEACSLICLYELSNSYVFLGYLL